MTNKNFASKYPRNGLGWILFPRDVEFRRKLFPNPKLGSKYDVFQHPAKMQLYLVEELIDYTSKPGDWIYDPFGGTGSTALAVLTGRNVALCEVEQDFMVILEETAELLIPKGKTWPIPNGWTRVPEDNSGLGELRVYLGDNRRVSRDLPANSMTVTITSPPYSNALLNTGRLQATMRDTYVGNHLNMGSLNPFLWQQAMNDLWIGLAHVTKPGGRVVMVNKDMRKNDQRELLSLGLLRGAKDAGLEYEEWHKWATPGTNRTRAMMAKGGEAILDEDILLFRKSI